MTFLPQFDYDIFVSYSLVNDELRLEGRPWVRKLVEELTIKLKNNLPENGKNVKFYYAGKGDLKAGQQLASCRDEAKKSALFLIIGSPRYLDIWPASELRAFTERIGPSDRVFIAELLPLPEGSAYPDAIGDPLRLTFYEKTERGAPRPFSKIDDECEDALTDLAATMAERLVALSPAEPTAPDERPPNPAFRTVLVAVTADLASHVARLRSHLKQFDVAVVPPNDFQEEGEAFREEFAGALEQASIVVQLLGANASRHTKSFPAGLEAFQAEAARARDGCQLLQWRDPALDPASIESSAHRELVFSDSVDAMSFEDFKDMVVKLATTPPPPPPPPPGRSYLFIDADRVDADTARQVFAACQKFQVPAVMPEYGVDQPKDFRDNYSQADRIAVIYEKSDPRWLNSQLRLFVRTAARRRARKDCIIYLGPPPPKSRQSLSIYHPNFVIVEAPNGDLESLFGKLF